MEKLSEKINSNTNSISELKFTFNSEFGNLTFNFNQNISNIILKSENQMSQINTIIDDMNLKNNRLNKAENDIDYIKNILSTMTDQ